MRSRRRASNPSPWKPRKAWRSSTAPSPRWPWGCWRCWKPRTWPTPLTSPPRSHSTRCAARPSPTMSASTPPAPSPGSSRRRATSPACWKAAKSASRTNSATACRTPTPSAAPRRCTAACEKRSRMCGDSLKSSSTAAPTTRWCSPSRARSSPVETSTARRWRWRWTCSPLRWRNWATSANGAPSGSSTLPTASCPPSSPATRA